MTTTAIQQRLDPEFAQQPTSIIQQPTDSLVAVMDKLANNPNLDADKIERMLNIFIDGQRKMAEMADERAFSAAMADFKRNPPRILKNHKAKLKGTAKGSGREYEFEYSYADLNDYCEEAMPMLAERGITWSFPFSESNGQIVVSCVLRYGLYTHTPTTLSASPEGGANPIQAKGVAVAYLERYTFAGATGLTAAMPDTDGRVPAKADAITEKQEADLQDYADALRQCETLPQLKNIFADAYKYAGTVNAHAKSEMARVYEDCKRRLQ